MSGILKGPSLVINHAGDIHKQRRDGYSEVLKRRWEVEENFINHRVLWRIILRRSCPFPHESDLRGPPREGGRILQSRYHRWWVMDFGVWPRDKTPKSRVAHCKLSPSQESENEQIQNQVYFSGGQSEDRPQGICATRTNCQSNFLSGSPWKTQDMCDQALHALGSCTTTTPHVTPQSPSMNFWQKKAFLCFLSPCDFFLFPRLKNHLKERHFGTLDNIQKSVTDDLKGIPAEAFQHCYEKWKQGLRRRVAAQGKYFEGDNLDL